MTIGEMIRQGLGYARRLRSLWLFGFFVGLGGGGSGGVGGHGDKGGGGSHAGAAIAHGFQLSPAAIAALIAGGVLLFVAAFLFRFISEGALIEGVARDRAGQKSSFAQGLRDGWANFGVLLRIGLLFGLVIALSLVAGFIPVASAFKLGGAAVGIPVAVVAVLVGIPWLITLAMIQMFAARIAVLEDRRAMDAIRKARLFLHGRIVHGLRLIVASWLGSLVLGFFGLLVIAPMVAILALLVPVLHLPAVLIIGCVLALPVVFIGVAMMGTLQSSIWTLGYVSEVET